MLGPKVDTAGIEESIADAVPGFVAQASVYTEGGGVARQIRVTVATGGREVTGDSLQSVCRSAIGAAGEDWVGTMRIIFVDSDAPNTGGSLQDIAAAASALGIPGRNLTRHGIEGSIPELASAC